MEYTHFAKCIYTLLPKYLLYINPICNLLSFYVVLLFLLYDSIELLINVVQMCSDNKTFYFILLHKNSTSFFHYPFGRSTYKQALLF